MRLVETYGNITLKLLETFWPKFVETWFEIAHVIF